MPQTLMPPLHLPKFSERILRATILVSPPDQYHPTSVCTVSAWWGLCPHGQQPHPVPATPRWGPAPAPLCLALVLTPTQREDQTFHGGV